MVQFGPHRSLRRLPFGIAALLFLFPLCLMAAAQTADVHTAALSNDAGLVDAPTPQAHQPQPSAAPAQNPPQQAPSSSQAPSLSDLGLGPDQVRGNAQQQAILDRRTHMLKVHQRLGLLTTIPLAATLISSGGAKNEHGQNRGNTTGMDVHAALGGVAVGMYAATAYYAIRAPKVEGTQSRGAIRLHKALGLGAWARHGDDAHPGSDGLQPGE